MDDIEKAHDELVEFYNIMKDKKLKRFSSDKIVIDSDDAALEASLGYKGAGIVILKNGTVYIFQDPGPFRGKRFSADWWVWVLKGRNNSIYSYMAENVPELKAALQNWSCVKHYTSIAEQSRE